MDENGDSDLEELLANLADSDVDEEGEEEATWESDGERGARVTTSSSSSTPPLHSTTSRQQQTVTASAVPHKSPLKAANTRSDRPGDEFKEQLSGIRVSHRRISSIILEDKLKGCKFVRLSGLQKHARAVKSDEAMDGIVTIGVVAEKGRARTTVNGKKFSIWNLTDLEGHQISVFLFGEAFKTFWKEMEGSLICLHSPSVVPPRMDQPKDTKKKSELAISISSKHQLLLIGMAMDFGHCKAMRRDNNPCTMAVNTRESSYCVYHVKAEFNKLNRKQKKTPGKSGKQFKNPMLQKIHNSIPRKSQFKAKSLLSSGNNTKILPQNMRSFTTSSSTSSLSRRTSSFSSKSSLSPANSTKTRRNIVGDNRIVLTGNAPSSSSSSIQRSPSTGSVTLRSGNSVIPQIGRNWNRELLNVKSPRDSQRSVANRKKAEAIILARGPIEPPNPNSSKSSRSKLRKALKQRINGSSKTSAPSRAARIATAKTSFARSPHSKKKTEKDGKDGISKKRKSLLGEIDVQAVMQKRSRNEDILNEKESEQRTAIFNALGKKEALAELMAKTDKLDIKAWKCYTCNVVREVLRRKCKDEQHRVRTVNAIKYFFYCSKCRKEATSVNNKIYRKSCEKCGGNRFERTGMLAAPKFLSKPDRNLVVKDMGPQIACHRV